MSDRHRLEHRRGWDKEVDESQSLPPRRSGCLGLRKIHSFRFIVTTLLEIQFGCAFFQSLLTGHDHFIICLKQLCLKRGPSDGEGGAT